MIKEGQIVVLSNDKKFSKFIISYRLNSKGVFSNSFIIDLNNKDEIFENMEYKAITSYHISDNEINNESRNKMKISERDTKVWNKAENCNCSSEDCEQNHKLCGICRGTMIWGAHKSNQPNSKFAWNVDHIIPISKGGSNYIENLQAVHVVCNTKKGNV